MATTTRTTTWSSGDTLTASALNGEFNNLLNAVAIVNADVSGSAGIVFSKLDSVTVAGVTATQTLTNKTLTAPVISTISNTGTLTLPTSTDTLVGRATTDTLTNKTLTTPVIASISNSGTITVPTGTDTLVGRATTDTLTNKTLTTPVIASISNSGTITVPTGTDTLVGRATTDTLTNKTITAPVLSGSVTGTYTLAGTPSFSKPTINASVQGTSSLSPSAAATQDLDGSTDNVFLITMPAGNITFTVSNMVAGQFFYVRILQDGTGSRTVTWFSTITWAGAAAPTLTTTGSRADLFAFFAKTSTTFDGFIVGQNIG